MSGAGILVRIWGKSANSVPTGMSVALAKRRTTRMIEYADCEYYDADDDVCMAMDCTPLSDCTAPLPCEEESK